MVRSELGITGKHFRRSSWARVRSRSYEFLLKTAFFCYYWKPAPECLLEGCFSSCQRTKLSTTQEAERDCVRQVNVGGYCQIKSGGCHEVIPVLPIYGWDTIPWKKAYRHLQRQLTNHSCSTVQGQGWGGIETTSRRLYPRPTSLP